MSSNAKKAPSLSPAIEGCAERKLGLLARYSRWSHDRPWTGFGVVVGAVFLIAGVVVAANLVQFTTDDDKVSGRQISPTRRFLP
jgi:hypothetical protein